jgi:triacylglycerol esterase/lipase EstA (alpha/beta hydrolase family)
LEERDKYFTRLKDMIEQTKRLNGGKKVVLIGHSMGNRTLSYFLHWIGDRSWIDEHVHAWMALGTHFLGNIPNFINLLKKARLGWELGNFHANLAYLTL